MIRPITPENILKIIDSLPKDLIESQANMKGDFVSLKRFYLKKHCPRLTLQYIATITGCKSHRTVIDSIKKINGPDFLFIRKIIEDQIERFVSEPYVL